MNKTVLDNHSVKKGGEGGIAILERLTLIALLLFVVIKVLDAYLSPLYDYWIMRDTAKRVAREYAALPLSEVRKRVQFEFDRSHIPMDDETFLITPKDPGYRVDIDFRLPLTITFGEYKLGEDKVIHISFHAES